MKHSNSPRPIPDDSEFEAMLNDYLPSDPDEFDVGDQIEGTIIKLGDTFAFVSFGDGHQGYAALEEFRDSDGSLSISVGDTVNLWVCQINDDGFLLSKGLRNRGAVSIKILQNALESGIPVQGTVTAVKKGGFEISLGQHAAFCPLGKIDTGYCENPEEFIGVSDRFKILQITEKGRNIIVSRKDVLEEERVVTLKWLTEQFQNRVPVNGTISRILRFGVMVNVSGVDCFMPIQEIAHQHVDHPEDLVQPGDDVKVLILEMGLDDRQRERISVSMKALLPDPWQQPIALSPGETVVGKALRLVEFGVFVEVLPGITGLVHKHEFPSKFNFRREQERFIPGSDMTVKILDIDQGRRRISLSMNTAPDAPETHTPHPGHALESDHVETDGGPGRFSVFGKLLGTLNLQDKNDNSSRK